MLILRKVRRRTKRTTGQSASPQSLDRAGNTLLGEHFQAHEGQEGNQRESTQARQTMLDH